MLEGRGRLLPDLSVVAHHRTAARVADQALGRSTSATLQLGRVAKKYVTGHDDAEWSAPERAVALRPAETDPLDRGVAICWLGWMSAGCTGVGSVLRDPREATATNPFGPPAREQEVLGWVRSGHTDAQIAVALHPSVRTVGHHVSVRAAQDRRDLAARAAIPLTRMGLSRQPPGRHLAPSGAGPRRPVERPAGPVAPGVANER